MSFYIRNKNKVLISGDIKEAHSNINFDEITDKTTSVVARVFTTRNDAEVFNRALNHPGWVVSNNLDYE